MITQEKDEFGFGASFSRLGNRGCEKAYSDTCVALWIRMRGAILPLTRDADFTFYFHFTVEMGDISKTSLRVGEPCLETSAGRYVCGKY